jgi:hypothetical protein
VRLPSIVIEPKRSGNSALEKLLQCPRRLAWRSRGGDFYPANLTEIIIDIYLPPVASSPLDRGWHIALTPLRAPAIRDYLDVRAMNGCPTKALELVGSITGDDDKALSHGLTPWVGQSEIFGGVGGQHPPTASPLVSCAESPARPSWAAGPWFC